MAPEADPSGFVSYSDDTSLPRKGCKVAMQGEVVAGTSLDWYHDLLKRGGTCPGKEIKSSDIIRPFFELPEYERRRLFLTLKAVRIHITDPRLYYGMLDGILPLKTNIIDFLQRLAREEHVAKAQIAMREFIAEQMLGDAPSEYVKILYRALEFTNMVRIRTWNEQPTIHPPDLTLFECGTSNIVNQIPPYLSQSGPVFHHAADAILASEGGGFLYGAYAMNRALRQPHAFDKGKATILPWIQRRRVDLIEFTDPHKLFSRTAQPLRELDSKDSLPIRAADFAVAIAREIWDRSSLVQLTANFEYVTYNGRRISEAQAAEYQDRLSRFQGRN
jgi:hypothetical protein